MDTRIEKGESALTAHELAARRAGDGERSTRRALARLGEVAAPGGALVLFVSTLLHPLNSDPNAPRAAFAEYTADSVWVWSHLGQFAGLAMLGAALVALAATLEPGRAAAWARIGVAGAASMVTVGAALQAVDGVALKVVVDRWASVTGEASASAFEAAFAVRQIEVGLASLLSLVSGLTLTVFGVALALNARYPAWLGGLGLLGGIGTVASGAAQASTGFSGLAITISMLASIVLLVWTVVVGFLMWRSAPRLEAIPHDDRYRKGPVRDGAGSPAFGASAKKIAPPESRKHEGERSDGQDQHALPRLERGVARRTDRDGNAHGDRRPRRDQTEVQPEDPGGARDRGGVHLVAAHPL